MQFSIATAITTVLLGSALTSAAAIPQVQQDNSIRVQLKTGNGDASVQNSVLPGSLQTKQSTDAPFADAVTAKVVDAGFTCQAFSDAKGQKKLGSRKDPKTNAILTTFDDSQDGEAQIADPNVATGEVADNGGAVPIGSYCCAPTAQFQKVCGKFGAGKVDNGKGSKKGINNGSNGAAAGNANADAFNVRIQINGADAELATQGEILANGKPQALSAPLIGEDSIGASIVTSDKPAECTAFDKNGKKLGAFGSAGASFVGNIETVACSQVSKVVPLNA
jgi:hypothetical protein